MSDKELVGRPSKFNGQVASLILADVKDGIPYKICAESNGIAEKTLYNWLLYGIDDVNNNIDSEFSQFLQAMRSIEKDRIKTALLYINSSEKGHRGYEWTMERSFWKYFSSHAQNIEMNERLENLEKSKENK